MVKQVHYPTLNALAHDKENNDIEMYFRILVHSRIYFGDYLSYLEISIIVLKNLSKAFLAHLI